MTLNPGGYRVFVAGTLALGDGASIARNGNEGDPDSGGDIFGGTGLSAGTLGGSGSGAGELTPSAPSITNSLGGDGGNDIGPCCGGAANPPADEVGGEDVFRQAFSAISGRSLDNMRVNGGAGGDGPGGSGGGVIVVAARTIVANGSAVISATGGDGINASGGGGGGVVVVITSSAQPAGLTLDANGGAGSGSGTNGEPGFTAWLD